MVLKLLIMKAIILASILFTLFSCKDNLSKTNSTEAVTTTSKGGADVKENKSDTLSGKPELSTFAYNPNAGEYRASVKELGMADVENLMKNELEIMRNEIFARHGYSFVKKKELREYFENQAWYVAKTDDVKADLTPLEKKNIALILRLEDYADQHGDDFGR